MMESLANQRCDCHSRQHQFHAELCAELSPSPFSTLKQTRSKHCLEKETLEVKLPMIMGRAPGSPVWFSASSASSVPSCFFLQLLSIPLCQLGAVWMRTDPWLPVAALAAPVAPMVQHSCPKTLSTEDSVVEVGGNNSHLMPCAILWVKTQPEKSGMLFFRGSILCLHPGILPYLIAPQSGQHKRPCHRRAPHKHPLLLPPLPFPAADHLKLTA